MRLYDKRCEIKFITSLSDDTYHLGIVSPEISESCIPGQFLMVRVNDDYEPLLRRPFSIFRTEPKEGIVEIVFEVVGKGTKILSERRSGEFLDVLGPLGKEFKINSKNLILIGGGIGFPPLFFMADFQKSENRNVVFYYGARTKDGIFFEKELGRICNKLIITTEDGSLGEKGLITDVFIKDLETGIIRGEAEVFSCGPTAMSKEISSICKRYNLKSQVSLESVMACGTGLCQGCVVRVENAQKSEYKLVCKDGPVFDSDIIIWED